MVIAFILFQTIFSVQRAHVFSTLNQLFSSTEIPRPLYIPEEFPTNFEDIALSTDIILGIDAVQYTLTDKQFSSLVESLSVDIPHHMTTDKFANQYAWYFDVDDKTVTITAVE